MKAKRRTTTDGGIRQAGSVRGSLKTRSSLAVEALELSCARKYTAAIRTQEKKRRENLNSPP